MKKNLVFAADIDNTLLFSMTNKEATLDAGCIYVADSENNTLQISLAAHTILKKIHAECTFIPVTTRSLGQYNRLDIFKNEIAPRFAIVTNGGNILIDGKVDMEYRVHLMESSREESKKYMSKVAERLEQVPSELIIRTRIVDDCFYLLNLSARESDKPEIRKILSDVFVDDNLYIVSIQENKVYILPKYISKESALDYIMKKYSLMLTVTAGDALTDVNMLRNSKLALVPATGELARIYDEKWFQDQNFVLVKGGSPVITGERLLELVRNFLGLYRHFLTFFVIICMSILILSLFRAILCT